jgi:hypothetical protein
MNALYTEVKKYYIHTQYTDINRELVVFVELFTVEQKRILKDFLKKMLNLWFAP